MFQGLLSPEQSEVAQFSHNTVAGCRPPFSASISPIPQKSEPTKDKVRQGPGPRSPVCPEAEARPAKLDAPVPRAAPAARAASGARAAPAAPAAPCPPEDQRALR